MRLSPAHTRHASDTAGRGSALELALALALIAVSVAIVATQAPAWAALDQIVGRAVRFAAALVLLMVGVVLVLRRRVGARVGT